MISGYQIVTGTAAPVNGAVDATIVAAQGAGKKLHLLRGIICITVAGTGGGGLCAIEDGAGGTRYVDVPAAVVGAFPFDFGDEGIPMTANTLLNATVDGAATNQASARVTVVCKVVG